MIAWLPELLYHDGRFESGVALVCAEAGKILKVARVDELTDEKRVSLPRRAMLPGMVNAHSHAFQRVLRGRAEFRTANQTDSFWTWRELMYSAATRLMPDDVYDASRMAFLEMALSGVTAVGEFHYLHHAPEGNTYDDPNLLAKEVIRAAGDVGLRIALLKVAYARSGFQTGPNPRQARFTEATPDVFLKNLSALAGSVSSETAWIGVAPHSVRALPLDYLKEVIAYANQNALKIHMHVAEQPAEVSACIEEHGRTPFALLESEGLLSDRFTAVHAIHVTPKAVRSFAATGALGCACPTTERNLGDGVVPAGEYVDSGVPICLGSDSHIQIDLFEDARELEYHLRLQKLARVVLSVRTSPAAEHSPRVDDLAALLFECATINGARSVGAPGGMLSSGKPADFFTVDLDDPSIAGAAPENLLAAIVFSSTRAAVREVVVGGKPIVSEGRHVSQQDVIERFNDLQKRLW